MNEPTLEEIWAVRREIFAECGNDPYQLIAYYIVQQNAELSDTAQQLEPA